MNRVNCAVCWDLWTGLSVFADQACPMTPTGFKLRFRNLLCKISWIATPCCVEPFSPRTRRSPMDGRCLISPRLRFSVWQMPAMQTTTMSRSQGKSRLSISIWPPPCSLWSRLHAEQWWTNCSNWMEKFSDLPCLPFNPAGWIIVYVGWIARSWTPSQCLGWTFAWAFSFWCSMASACEGQHQCAEADRLQVSQWPFAAAWTWRSEWYAFSDWSRRHAPDDLA